MLLPHCLPISTVSYPRVSQPQHVMQCFVIVRLRVVGPHVCVLVRCSKELEVKEDVRKLFEGMGACSSFCGEGGDDDIGRLFFLVASFSSLLQ